jgi:hypothetical protein
MTDGDELWKCGVCGRENDSDREDCWHCKTRRDDSAAAIKTNDDRKNSGCLWLLAVCALAWATIAAIVTATAGSQGIEQLGEGLVWIVSGGLSEIVCVVLGFIHLLRPRGDEDERHVADWIPLIGGLGVLALYAVLRWANT